jgi:hypothetical protein
MTIHLLYLVAKRQSRLHEQDVPETGSVPMHSILRSLFYDTPSASKGNRITQRDEYYNGKEKHRQPHFFSGMLLFLKKGGCGGKDPRYGRNAFPVTPYQRNLFCEGL